MQPLVAIARLTNGLAWEDIPLTLPSRMAWERAAKANGWTAEANPFTTGAFLSWHAAKLAGRHDLSWDEFVKVALEADVVKAPGGAHAADPTQTASSEPPSP